MAAPALRQSAVATATNNSTKLTATLPAAPLDGSLIVALFTIRADASVDITDPGAIWHTAGVVHAPTNGGYQTMAWAWASGGSPQSVEFVNAANYKRLVIAEFTGVDPVQAPVDTSITDRTNTTTIDLDLLPTQDGDLCILGVLAARGVGGITVDTNDSAWSEIDQGQVGGNFMPRGALYWRLASGDDVDGDGFTSANGQHGARMVTFRAGDNVPTGGEGEEGGPPSVLPEKEDDPGAAILEVYVVDASAPRWDVALWDDSYVWGEGGWRDITPQGIVADIHWGSDQAERGILAGTRAAVWTVTTYDPERVLDPANADGPAYPYIVPFLPIRLRHRAVTIRTGYVERISYDYATERGLIRATDAIGRMSAADVPADQVPFLSTQLHQRARDAILAAGLDVYVPFGNAPWGAVELAPLADGEYTVWDVIATSALEALYVPYLDKDEQLRFRPYAWPPDKGLRIAADELVGLTVEMTHDGLVSAVALTDYSDADLEILHAITPTPAYGTRLYTRSERTILGAQWADAILADRGTPSVRLIPGRIRPSSATRVETMARIAQMDTVQIAHEYTAPQVEAQGRVLGLRVRVESNGPAEVDWQWWLDIASSGVGPLIADYLGDLPPLDYLIDDESGEYLYPDGVLVTEVL